MNGDPYIGMLETPVTSAPIVAGYLSNLPAYRTGVSPLLRGVEIGLAHGLLVGGSSRRCVSGASSCCLPASACGNASIHQVSIPMRIGRHVRMGHHLMAC